jgi:Integrase core domain
MCPSLHYRGHATPGQAVPGLRTSMTGALTADDVEAACSPCGDSSDKLQEWQDFYNYHRPHGSLGGQTPYESSYPSARRTSVESQALD